MVYGVAICGIPCSVFGRVNVEIFFLLFYLGAGIYGNVFLSQSHNTRTLAT